jgi:NAD(P)-dependent dehydrogenase (short-subunit alcohol dehydrogenase family)
VLIDVTSVDSVAAAVAQLRDEAGRLGVVRVTQAFLPLLRASEAPVIVNVSSGLGSFGVMADPDRMESRYPTLAYGSAKAAVNMLTLQYAKAFPDIRINAVDPGYTATDLNAHRGTQTVEEGAEIIVRMAQTGPDGRTGGYFDRHGPVPW